MRTLGYALVWLLSLGVGGSAHAGQRDFVVQLSSVGSATEQAAPYIATFLRYAEQKLGWPTSSAKGAFFPDADGAIEYIAKQHPGFGMMEPALWLKLRKKEGLVVLASIEGKGTAAGHYSLVVKDPAYKTLEDLKGKILISNHLSSPEYLSKVAFDGKLEVASYFELRPTPSPLKGLKAVDRGDAAATLLDDEQLANLKSLPFGAKLRVVYTSPALPPTPLVAFGKSSTAADRAALGKLVVGMCRDSKGAEVCKALQISRFSPPDQAKYQQAIRRYDK